jgi:hypothetical protein
MHFWFCVTKKNKYLPRELFIELTVYGSMQKIIAFLIVFIPFGIRAQQTTMPTDSVRQLKEVSITSQKNLVEFKNGKTIYNVEQSLSATGTDMLSVLKKTPGVLVTNNSISMSGKGSVSVMINNRLQQISMEDLLNVLRALPSDQVSKLEVITQPSSRYDAEGNAGILNIILKKNQKEGIRGSTSLSSYYNGLWGASNNISLHLKKGKLLSWMNFSMNQIAYPYTSWNKTFYSDNYWYYDIDEKRTLQNARLGGGIEYQYNKKTTLTVSVANAVGRYKALENSVGISTKYNGLAMDQLITTGITKDRAPYKLNGVLGFEYKIDTLGKRFTAEYDSYWQTSSRVRNFVTEQQSPSGISDNRIDGLPSTQIQSVKADLEIPRKKYTLSTGVKASFVKAAADNKFYDRTNNQWVLRTNQSNQFTYTERIQAIYVTFQRQRKKIDLSVGCRAERTQAEGWSTTLQQAMEQHYVKLFPTLQLQITLPKEQGLGIFVTRRIRRPDYGNLNPFRFYYSPQTYAVGNPSLLPAFHHVFALTYTYKSMLRAELSYNHGVQYFDRVILIDSIENTSRITRANIGSTDYVGLEITYQFNPRPRWDLSGSINGASAAFSPDEGFGNRTYQQFNAWFELNNSWSLNTSKTWMLELTGYYYSPRQKDMKVWKSMSSVNTGIKYSFLKKKATATLQLVDIFKKTYWLQVNSVNGSTEYSYDGERSLQLSFNYRFGNKNIRSVKQRSATEEIQRANQ